jgi:D-3-phosphoglycerate dehydrogenase
MSFRVFVTGSGISRDAQNFLENEDCVLMQGDPVDSPTDIVRKMASFSPDALIVRQGHINDDVIAASADLKVICKHGTGTDNIDIDAASRRNIPVMYTPDANYESAAEHALGLILSLFRKIPEQDRNVRNGNFDKKGFSGQELLGKTLGLVGFGRVARRLSELVAPFKMAVVVYDPFGTEEALPPYISKASSLADVLCQSNIVSLHAPLTPDTRGMINSDTLALMKNDAYLINTARGPIVNEGHLIKALQDGQIMGAALDTFEEEPPPADSPLYHMDNVVLTMHTAGNSDLSLKNMAMGSARNVLSALRNERLDPATVLNPEAVSIDQMHISSR